MTQVFRGDVLLPGDAGGLNAAFKLDHDNVTLTAGDELLGSWSKHDYQVGAFEDGGFHLSLGGESVVFKPESPAEFATAMAVPLQPHTDDRRDRREAKAERRAERKAAKEKAKAEAANAVEEFDLIASVKPVKDLTSDDDFISPALMRAIIVSAAVVTTIALVVILFV